MAQDWREVLETNAWSQGKGAPNPLIPAALKDWSIPIDQLPPEGRQLYEFDPGRGQAPARRGRPSRTASRSRVETTPGYGPDWMDAVQVGAQNWKAGRASRGSSS